MLSWALPFIWDAKLLLCSGASRRCDRSHHPFSWYQCLWEKWAMALGLGLWGIQQKHQRTWQKWLTTLAFATPVWAPPCLGTLFDFGNTKLVSCLGTWIFSRDFLPKMLEQTWRNHLVSTCWYHGAVNVPGATGMILGDSWWLELQPSNSCGRR